MSTTVARTLVPSAAATRALRYSELGALFVSVIDLATFCLAAIGAEWIVYRDFNFISLLQFLWHGPIVFIVLWSLLFARIGLYRVSYAMTVRDEFYIVVVALLLGVIPQFVLFSLVPTLSGSRLVLIVAALLAMILTGTTRATLHVARARAAARTPRRLVLCGNTSESGIRSKLEEVEGTTIFDAGPLPQNQRDVVALIERCCAVNCTTLYLDGIPPSETAASLIARAEAFAITLRIALAPLLAASAYRFALEDDARGFLLAPRPLRVRTPSGMVAKRLFDIAIALPMLLVASPVMLLAALAIVIETGFPIFYRHERIGCDGVPFEMLKFRSMYVKHNYGDGWAQRRDPRITRVGAVLRRCSIDELPQLFNVLRGDMSIVGPRPEMPAYVQRFEATIPQYADRHLVRPGITGWSQIYMKRLLTPEDVPEVLRHDLFYIENWGLFMDLSIIAKTGIEFLFHSPA